MKRLLTLAGAAGPAVGALGVAAAAYINRDWWDPRTTSVSHLGRYTDPAVSHPEVLNISLLLCALLTMIYTAYILAQKRREVPTAGLLLYTAGLFFLALVSIFPSGTPPHYPASISFFLLTQAAVLAFAVAYRGRGLYSALSLALFLSGTFSFYLFLQIWEGDGMGELSWVVTLILWHYMTLRHIGGSERLIRSEGEGRPGPSTL